MSDKNRKVGTNIEQSWISGTKWCIPKPPICLHTNYLTIIEVEFCPQIEHVLDFVEALPKLRVTLASGGKDVTSTRVFDLYKL
jgi:hypothetical protein